MGKDGTFEVHGGSRFARTARERAIFWTTLVTLARAATVASPVAAAGEGQNARRIIAAITRTVARVLVTAAYAISAYGAAVSIIAPVRSVVAAAAIQAARDCDDHEHHEDMPRHLEPLVQ
jgi:hypothetical protein